MKQDKKRYTVETLARYWPSGIQNVINLPIPDAAASETQSLPANVKFISLPEWGRDLGDDGKILVPVEYIQPGDTQEWQRTAWWAVAFWYLNGLAEREFEARHGPIHSYSFRLKSWDARLWQKPWVNHIALFIRRWAAVSLKTDEERLLGQIPETEIILTHDVDSVSKTVKIRLKQAAFHTFNAVRSLSRMQIVRGFTKAGDAAKVVLRSDDYWCFEAIRELERRYNQRSVFNFYAGAARRNRKPTRFIIDPDYDVRTEKIRNLLRNLLNEGCQLGLHPSYDSWNSAEKLQQERDYLQKAAGHPISICRQHWLMFSWHQTWAAQEAAGLRLDMTLGFNDRPAFRNGAALRFHPWSENKNAPMSIEAIPLVLMDSHLYDYQQFTDEERFAVLANWIDEIKRVKGTATVVWHQRVMSRDYGWYKSYEKLLELI